MQSPELLEMIENCPPGSETLVARIVHLLTERGTLYNSLNFLKIYRLDAPTLELVEKVRSLHKRRNTDVRSLLPIITGLKRQELLELIPKFVMNATNSKSVPVFFRKLMFGRHIETHEPLMSPKELLRELHNCVPANIREQGHLIQSNPLYFLRLIAIHFRYRSANLGSR
jgi:symplekin